MFDQIPFVAVAGADSRRHIQFLALSTCGFCKRGQAYLERHGLAYEFVHLDTLGPEVKAQVKAEFKEQFDSALSYPALVINGTVHTVGFVKHAWAALLDLPEDDDPPGGDPHG